MSQFRFSLRMVCHATKTTLWGCWCLIILSTMKSEPCSFFQVYEECAALVRATHLKVVALHGGQPLVDEVLAIRKGMHGGGADIIVSTPGRLLDHVEVCAGLMCGCGCVLLCC